jgi:GLPGLI family protein
MRVLIIGFLVFVSMSGVGQVASGKIVFERKTNLLKKYTDDRMKAWLKDKKLKIDMFELYFNDTMSVFKPQESDLAEQMDWSTTKNTVYQNLNQNQRLSVLGVWGDNVYVLDTLNVREWKMTSSKRKIAGYECRRVIWQKNDTTRIHAWYTSEIIPSVGPESFGGLPGTILGLATEDGGVVYFAKSVEVGVKDIASHIPEYPAKKVKTEAELRIELAEKFGDKPWGKLMLEGIFAW